MRANSDHGRLSVEFLITFRLLLEIFSTITFVYITCALDWRPGDILSFLSVLAVRAERSDEVRVIKLHVYVSIVPSDPVFYIFFLEIITELEIPEKTSKIIRIDGPMGILVNVSEHLQHTEILVAHQFLF